MNMKMSDKASQVQQIRSLCNIDNDITVIREAVNLLIASFKTQSDMSKKFNENFKRCGDLVLDLEEHFKQVTDPLRKFISNDTVSLAGSSIDQLSGSSGTLTSDLQSRQINMKSSCCNGHGNNSESEGCNTRTVCISNLNEFICENVISEYLRQNNIFVAQCIQTLGYNERSRNFQVIVRHCDLDKILSPDLWPRGVTLSVRDDSTIPKDAIHGIREKILPALVISSGMSYWHS